ncbi:MAG: 2-C-methyl-D-erythritol 2,4-cyclodiphosphate synthase [Halanaerobiaceae bacterium]
MRSGIGFDVHKFEEGKKIIIGGEEIFFSRKLKGHSDADVLLHALMDALLGAMGKGDIGRHFPDTEKKYKDISSIVLLKKVRGIMREEGFIVNNIDMIVMAQAPKLAPYADKIENNICQVLDIGKSRVNFKATTTEKLGFVGRQEGIAAQVVVTVAKV